jgi:hypothetical protein
MKSYLNLDLNQGYPAGKDIFYECGQCGDVIPSQPKESLCCSCGNICIDVDAGRISVKDHSLFKVFRDA